MHRIFSRVKGFSRMFCTKRATESTSSSTASTTSSSSGGFFSFYSRCLEESPILTKCITSGILSFAADMVCQIQFPDPQQQQIGKKSTDKSIWYEQVDFWRVVKFTTLGACFTGPILHFWYGFLARRLPGASLGNAIQRLALDQLVFAPCFVPSFFAAIMLLDGKPHLIKQKLAAEWFPTMLTNYTVWVPAMFVNFLFVPPLYQVLFSNGVGFGWNIYISYVSYKPPVVGGGIPPAVVSKP